MTVRRATIAVFATALLVVAVVISSPVARIAVAILAAATIFADHFATS